jgi:hypothetical protein
MPRKFEKASGRISLRISVELHEQLAAAANGIGIDVNGLINMMLSDLMPKYLSMAAERTRSQQVSRNLWSEIQDAIDGIDNMNPKTDRRKLENLLMHFMNSGPESFSIQRIADDAKMELDEVRNRIAQAEMMLASSRFAEKLQGPEEPKPNAKKPKKGTR